MPRAMMASSQGTAGDPAVQLPEDVIELALAVAVRRAALSEIRKHLLARRARVCRIAGEAVAQDTRLLVVTVLDGVVDRAPGHTSEVCGS